MNDFFSAVPKFFPSTQLVRRYDYYCGLRQGTSDLVGRDQTIANALVQMYHRTDIELFLAFVTKEESGQHCTMLLCLPFADAEHWSLHSGCYL